MHILSTRLVVSTNPWGDNVLKTLTTSKYRSIESRSTTETNKGKRMKNTEIPKNGRKMHFGGEATSATVIGSTVTEIRTLRVVMGLLTHGNGCPTGF